jgi:hypothetical protein
MAALADVNDHVVSNKDDVLKRDWTVNALQRLVLHSDHRQCLRRFFLSASQTQLGAVESVDHDRLHTTKSGEGRAVGKSWRVCLPFFFMCLRTEDIVRKLPSIIVIMSSILWPIFSALQDPDIAQLFFQWACRRGERDLTSFRSFILVYVANFVEVSLEEVKLTLSVILYAALVFLLCCLKDHFFRPVFSLMIFLDKLFYSWESKFVFMYICIAC